MSIYDQILSGEAEVQRRLRQHELWHKELGDHSSDFCQNLRREHQGLLSAHAEIQRARRIGNPEAARQVLSSLNIRV